MPQRSKTNCRTTFQYQLANSHARRGVRLLYRLFQLLPLRLVKGGGEPPACSNIRAAGHPSPKADAHRPMVCGSRSSASAVAAAVKPWAGVGWRTIAPAPGASAPESSAGANLWLPAAIVRETALSPSHPSPTPLSSRKANPVPPQLYPMPLHISLWLWFRYFPVECLELRTQSAEETPTPGAATAI